LLLVTDLDSEKDGGSDPVTEKLTVLKNTVESSNSEILALRKTIEDLKERNSKVSNIEVSNTKIMEKL
jgi:hypothetical protein